MLIQFRTYGRALILRGVPHRKYLLFRTFVVLVLTSEFFRTPNVSKKGIGMSCRLGR